ncbi:hypothetical protein RESH_03096 [Rhodopirellula europaea SH398]|uniref:Uncharacterized protein n=1 Tax=Rhodopirellula europaea SH398 TaxID=1263868 RepID=M5S458_9BACT|nr:hypothetical protein RESH_03096 [Rhodopirellula europaea SH398]
MRETLALLAVSNNTEIALAISPCRHFDIDRSPAGLLMRLDLFRQLHCLAEFALCPYPSGSCCSQTFLDH